MWAKMDLAPTDGTILVIWEGDGFNMQTLGFWSRRYSRWLEHQWVERVDNDAPEGLGTLDLTAYIIEEPLLWQFAPTDPTADEIASMA